MPVNIKQRSGEILYQRELYGKGGLTRLHWDHRDDTALSLLDDTDRRLVDLGCGEGITLERMIARFPDSQALGIDGMPENVAICRQHGLPAVLGDIYAIHLPDNSVDAVTLFEVIEHLDHPEAVVNQIHRVLRSGGKLLVVFPNDTVLKWARVATLRLREAAYDPGHVKQWTPRGMQRFLEEQGFSVFFSRCIPFGLWSLSAHCVVGAHNVV